jgi:hypothetical protein
VLEFINVIPLLSFIVSLSPDGSVFDLVAVVVVIVAQITELSKKLINNQHFFFWP